MKNIFNPLVKSLAKLVRPDRYIKLDGTSYHSKGVKACLEKPAMKASIVGAAAIVGINLMAQGSWDVTTSKMMHVIMDDCVKDFLWGVPFVLGLDWLHQRYQGIEKKAIDTKGTDLSREQITLKDIDHLEILQKTSTFCFSAHAVLTLTLLGLESRYGGSLSENSAIVDVFSVSMLAYFFNRAYNAKKVLDDDYVVCGKPPKKEETAKETSKVIGGVTNHRLAPL